MGVLGGAGGVGGEGVDAVGAGAVVTGVVVVVTGAGVSVAGSGLAEGAAGAGLTAGVVAGGAGDVASGVAGGVVVTVAGDVVVVGVDGAGAARVGFDGVTAAGLDGDTAVPGGVASARASDTAPSATRIVIRISPSFAVFKNFIAPSNGDPADAARAPAGCRGCLAREGAGCQLLVWLWVPFCVVSALLTAPLSAPFRANWLALLSPPVMSPAEMFTGTLALTAV